MGAHARGLLRRIFTADTSLALLHSAPCPVWFVPETRAA
jgi:nucleotide-binding universal stress UspA family protein